MSSEPGQAITGLRSGDVGEYVFVCGDPARVARIARGFQDAREVCNLREYRVATGTLDGVRVSAASTGIGAPSTAVLIEELANVGARTLIRIGNSGGLAPELELGDLVITTGAVRDDGTTPSYVPLSYPAVADYQVVAALVASARERGVRHRVGLTWSMDAFYARNAVLDAEGRVQPMAHAGYRPPGLAERIADWRQARVVNCEMESGALLTLANLYGLRAGCVCVVSDRAPWPGPSELDIDKNMDVCIEVALGAARALAKA